MERYLLAAISVAVQRGNALAMLTGYRRTTARAGNRRERVLYRHTPSIAIRDRPTEMGQVATAQTEPRTTGWLNQSLLHPPRTQRSDRAVEDDKTELAIMTLEELIRCLLRQQQRLHRQRQALDDVRVRRETVLVQLRNLRTQWIPNRTATLRQC